MEPMIVHENNNYHVIVNNDKTGYNIINRFTGVVEEEERTLPKAKYMAELMDADLVHNIWRKLATEMVNNQLEDLNESEGFGELPNESGSVN